MCLIDGRLPMAPTVDHVIPISEGGTDTKANVQLAHRICNLRKGKRGTPQQLRLVG
jgi:5-methylcytosine-specific restriction endonuclease McrA